MSKLINGTSLQNKFRNSLRNAMPFLANVEIHSDTVPLSEHTNTTAKATISKLPAAKACERQVV